MKIPVILQHDEEDCGAACMAMMAHYYGLKLPLVKFRDLMCFSNNGTSVYDIVKSAENLNFKAMPMKGSFPDFSEAVKKDEIHLPCIALIKSKVFYHFIVVYKITQKNVVDVYQKNKFSNEELPPKNFLFSRKNKIRRDKFTKKI